MTSLQDVAVQLTKAYDAARSSANEADTSAQLLLDSLFEAVASIDEIVGRMDSPLVRKLLDFPEN